MNAPRSTRPVLRPYQIPLVAALASARTNTLAVAPTGAGKTMVIGEVADVSIARGERVTIVAHRVELLEQVRERLSLWGHDVAVHGGGRRCSDIATTPILALSSASWRGLDGRGARGGVLIIDEAHHATADSYGHVARMVQPRVALGVTATPRRLDGSGLADAGFRAIVIGPQPAELVQLGALVSCDLHTTAPRDAYRGAVQAGEFRSAEASARMVELAGDTVEHAREIARHGPCAVFCVRVDHAQEVAARCTAAGMRAAVVHGAMHRAERDDVMLRLRAGELDVIASVDVLGEGVDVPELRGVVLARPTQSLTIYLQQIGRALRPAQGKNRAIVIDQAGNYHRHGHPLAPRRWSLEGAVERGKQARDDTRRDTSGPSGSLVVAEVDAALVAIAAPVFEAPPLHPDPDPPAIEAPAQDPSIARVVTRLASRLAEIGPTWRDDAAWRWCCGGASTQHAGAPRGWLRDAALAASEREAIRSWLADCARGAADAGGAWALDVPDYALGRGRKRLPPWPGPRTPEDAAALAAATSPALSRVRRYADADDAPGCARALAGLRGGWTADPACAASDAQLLARACKIAGKHPGYAYHLAAEASPDVVRAHVRARPR